MRDNKFSSVYDYGSGNGALFYLVNKKTNLISWDVNKRFIKFQKIMFNKRIQIIDINSKKLTKK